MLKIPKLTTLALLAALGCVSAESIADTYYYRVLNKGIKSMPGGTGSGATGGSGGSTSGTSTGGTSTGDGASGSTVYATSGVQYLYQGNVVTFLVLSSSGTEYIMTLRNSSTNELRGWLVNPAGGQAVVDMSRSTCGQTASTPTVLAPGASCTFILISRVYNQFLHPGDVLEFRSLQNAPIPGYLTIAPAVANPAGGGGGGTPAPGPKL